MRVDITGDGEAIVMASGSQSVRIEIRGDTGRSLCVLEISLNQAMAIAEYLANHRYPASHTRSGWELK
jgi:hypothetical protein